MAIAPRSVIVVALVALVALVAVPNAAHAGPARVDGLVGNPTGARNQVFLTDDLNVFLNPAQAAQWSGMALVSLGFDNSLNFTPFGGAIVGVGPVSVGLYLNRTDNAYSDGDALRAVVRNLINGGHGGQLSYTGGNTAPLYLPIDLMAAVDLDRVQIGLGATMAFGNSLTGNEVRTPDGFAQSQVVRASNHITLSGGVILPNPFASPELWVRGHFATAWIDSLTVPPTYPTDDPTLSNVVGIRGTGSFSGGIRVPLNWGDFVLTPAVTIGYAAGQPYLTDYLLDLPAEDFVTRVSDLSGTVGVGAEYSPNARITLVGTASLEWDLLTINSTNGMTGPDFLGNTTRNSRVRAPVLSIGAEGNPVGPLWIRGAVRAGAGGATQSLRVASQDADGDTARQTTGNNLGIVAFSASGGAGLRWEHVGVAANVGGFSNATALSQSPVGFRTWLDVSFYFPSISTKRESVTPERIPRPDYGARPPDYEERSP